MSRLVIRNTTQYPDDEVKELVRFGFSRLELPSPYSILVRVRHTRMSELRKRMPEHQYGASGRAHNYVYIKSDVPKGAGYEVHLNVSRPEIFPTTWFDRHGTSADIMLNDWREALVMIAAHEGKHIEEMQRGQTRRKRTRSGQRVEALCDGFAAKQIRRYRS